MGTTDPKSIPDSGNLSETLSDVPFRNFGMFQLTLAEIGISSEVLSCVTPYIFGDSFSHLFRNFSEYSKKNRQEDPAGLSLFRDYLEYNHTFLNGFF